MFKNSERRNDLDKAYHQLIRVVFDNVERMAEEHQKTPRGVVMMGKPAKQYWQSFAMGLGTVQGASLFLNS